MEIVPKLYDGAMPIDIWSPSDGLGGLNLCGDIQPVTASNSRARRFCLQQPFSQFISPGSLQRLPRAQIRFFLASTIPCGNAMIDASVENLMDRQATHRFTTSAWKSLRLSHNHVDNCFAVTHIPTRQITTNLICQN